MARASSASGHAGTTGAGCLTRVSRRRGAVAQGGHQAGLGEQRAPPRSSSTSITSASPGSREQMKVTTQSEQAAVSRMTQSAQSMVSDSLMTPSSPPPVTVNRTARLTRRSRRVVPGSSVAETATVPLERSGQGASGRGPTR